MKNLIILGASGFIGRNLSEYFYNLGSYNVYGTYLNNPSKCFNKITTVKADLTIENDVKKILLNKDIVIQAAAVTAGIKTAFEKPTEFISQNAVMNSILLNQICSSNIKHFLFLSCSVMYPPNLGSAKEDDFDSNNIYPKYFGGAWNKVYIEKMCEYYSSLFNIKFSVIRHSNIYGPYDKYDLDNAHVMGATINKVINNKDKTISVWGTGEEKRDLLYVTDFVESFNLIINHQKVNLKYLM